MINKIREIVDGCCLSLSDGCDYDGDGGCEEHADVALKKLLEDHDAQIRVDTIDECIELCRRIPSTYFTDDWLRTFVSKLNNLKEHRR